LNIFKSIKLTWWQGSLFKLSMIAGGMAIGTTWPEIFQSSILWLWIVAIIPGLYLSWVWWKQ